MIKSFFPPRDLFQIERQRSDTAEIESPPVLDVLVVPVRMIARVRYDSERGLDQQG
jgi:hypothetical protein